MRVRVRVSFWVRVRVRFLVRVRVRVRFRVRARVTKSSPVVGVGYGCGGFGCIW